jgi:hypothetical protein
LISFNSLSSCINRALHLFFLPLPVHRKRLDAAPLSRHLVLPIPEILFIWIQHHPPGFQPRLIYTRNFRFFSCGRYRKWCHFQFISCGRHRIWRNGCY